MSVTNILVKISATCTYGIIIAIMYKSMIMKRRLKSSHIMGDKINDVNRFWDQFRDLVIQSGVSDSYADWYVKWRQKFAVSVKYLHDHDLYACTEQAGDFDPESSGF